jgi:hypothetical protein
MNSGRGDLVNQIKAFEDIVCGVLGVPRSLIMSDTPHKSDAEGTHQTFQKTIMMWKSSIEAACGNVYNIVYASSIKGQLMKAIGKRKRTKELSDLYALKKRLQVEIVFPVSPFMGHDQLYTHYQRGVLPWDTYVEHACAHGCLPHKQMPEPKNRERSDSSKRRRGSNSGDVKEQDKDNDEDEQGTDDSE